MMLTVLLVIHIVGACAMGLAACGTGIVLWLRLDSSYFRCAALLGLLAGFEICSGVVLAFLSAHISAPAVCRDLGIYLSVWLVLEALLFIRMKKTGMFFPLVPALYPVIAGMLAIALAVPQGF